MRRRDFIVGAIAFGAPTSGRADGYERCNYQACEAGVEIGRIAANLDPQRQSQWCWAASVSMIFGHYGFRLSQERIVEETYGAIVNVPAITGYAISRNLDRDWIDDDGAEFTVQVEGLYDADAGIMSLTDSEIVAALTDERPLIIGNVSHAMVMTAVAYVPYPGRPQIFNFGVADPFPGRGIHGADSAMDLMPMHRGGRLRYLCLPRIEAR